MGARYYDFESIDYAGIVFLSSVSVMLALMAGSLSLVFALLLLARRQLPRPINPMVVSGIAMVLAGVYIGTL